MADINELDDLQFLRDIYEQARNRYRPSQLRIIILVEAPPENMERFFYYEDVKQHDALFLEVMGVLYPKQKDAYLKNGRPTDGKTDLLRRFQGDGSGFGIFIPYRPASLPKNRLRCFTSYFKNLKNMLLVKRISSWLKRASMTRVFDR
jgi:hypothetical protein